MAQARVTEYFAAKKKRRGEQPSKRRKVDFTETEPSITQLKSGPVTLKPCGIESGSNVIQQNGVTSKQQQHHAVKSSTVQNVRRSARSTVSRPEKSTRSSTRQSSRLQNSQKGTIPELLESISIKSKVQESDENRGFVDQASSKKIYAETTDCWDEHDGFSSNQEDSCCNTPQKASTLKRNARKRKKDQRILSAQVLQLQSTPSQKNSPLNSKKTLIPKSETAAKKKLDLNLQNQDENEGSPTDEQLQQASKEKLMNLAAAMSPPKAISPLPGTPQNTRASRRKKAAEPSSEKILAAIEQCKSLTQKTSKKPPLIDAATVKARLAKCGKLEELKAQLAQMNAAKAKSKPKKVKAKPAVSEKVESPKLQKFEVLDVEVEETTKEEVKVVPAYERYHHLSTPGAPTLSLPYKYRMLAEMFRGMDTVVSMLHNRSEIITFSKLKAAVQTMNKRNFEKSNAGQIKTVFPTGFTFRQEKGLPCYGGKTSGYQLTVEPNLEGHINKDAGDGVKRESNSRVTFTATHLLHRRGFFHHRLIDIVKRYHREFLSKLSKPLSIPDDKITRWHPQFKLDEVPDVDTSPLPEPPYEKKYHTAKDVLEATRGKTLPRVEKALENVAKQSELTSPSKPSQSVTSSPKPAVKGVPQSLLEKIRAKEAAKLAASLTRNPAEEKKILMMSRLPDMMRIVRNYFVTEKKSSLPMGNVIQKLQDSYRMSIALSDIETHVNLMVELAPEWMSLQQIRKGKYIKLNIAVELQQLQDRINGLIKQRA